MIFRFPGVLRLVLWLAFLAANRPAIAQVAFDLGNPPRAPKDVSHLPKTSSEASLNTITGGFSVNIQSREQVRMFYNAIYSAFVNVPINSTAVTTSCFPGTNSPAYSDAVLTRINWFRAMAGVPATIAFNSTFSTDDQAAALIMSANNQLSHFPSNTESCFSANGANAASNSNIALGVAGEDAITGYMQDPGTNNPAAGHRRWILYPQTQTMGTGDIPAENGFAPANAVWVIDGNYGTTRPATRTPFVTWPPAGYAPYQVVFPRWSIGFGNANFANATVTMLSNNVPVPVMIETITTGVGENSLVWVPMGLNQGDPNTLFPFSGADTVYSIAVSNIVGGPATFCNYTVTVFDPAVAGTDYMPPTITGTNQVFTGLTNAYSINPIAGATSYQWRQTLREPLNLFDGAENGATNFNVSVSPGYPYITNLWVKSGSEAYHLAMPDGGSQMLTFIYDLYPHTNGSLQFASTLGNATTNQFAKVQASTNGGSTWIDLYSQAGNGAFEETTYNNRSVSLASVANTSTLLRFNYTLPTAPGSYSYVNSIVSGGETSGFVVGWYIDNIVLTNCEQLFSPVTNSIPGPNFLFTATQAGNYNLDAQALIFTQYPVGFGPSTMVAAIPSPVPIVTLAPPAVNGSQLRLRFDLVSGAVTNFHLFHAGKLPNGAWTQDTGAVLSTNVPGSVFQFTTSTNGAIQFYRVQ